jgi:hypothetical protein
VPAWIGQRYTSPDWYQRLVQPAWAPPTFLFGPAWTLLYALVGFAAWLVWLEAGFAKALKGGRFHVSDPRHSGRRGAGEGAPSTPDRAQSPAIVRAAQA